MKKILVLAIILFAVMQVRATDYYTTSTTATLAGNSTTSTNWTTNTDGITGLGAVTVAVTDNLFILSGATVTISAATTVNNVTVSGGTSTTLACATFNLTINGNLSGTCKRTSTGGLLFMGGSGKTLSFIEVAGSSAPKSSFASTAVNTQGGIQIGASGITLSGATTTYGCVFFSNNTNLVLNGYTLTASLVRANGTNTFITGSSTSRIILFQKSNFSQTSYIYFDQTTPGTTNVLDSLSISSLSASYSNFLSIYNNVSFNNLYDGANSATSSITTFSSGATLTITGNYYYTAGLGIDATLANTSAVFGTSSTINYANETARPIRKGSNLTINGGTLNLQAFSMPPAVGTIDTLLFANITGTFSNLSLPTGYQGNLSYAGDTVITLNITKIPVNTVSDIFYFQPTSGNANTLANWNTAPDGSGTSPTSLTTGAVNRFYIIDSGKTATITASFGTSGVKIFVGDETGGSLTTGTPGTLYTATGSSYINATIYVNKNSTLHYRMPSTGPAGYPVINNSDPTGTVVYDGSVAQNVLPASYGYGNLTINNAAGASLTADISIMGTIAATSGTLNTNGHAITFNGSKAQTIPGNNVYTNGYADQITVNNDSAVTLANGATLNIKDSLIVNSGAFILGAGSNAIVNGVSYVPTTPVTDSTYKAGYTLVWNDEFNGAAGAPPNPAVWQHHYTSTTPSVTTINGTNYQSLSLTSNTYLDGMGHAIIRVADSSNGIFYFGDVDSRAGYVMKEYGYVECRMMFSPNVNINNSFWLQSQTMGTNPSANDPATYGTEMDVCEYLGPGSTANRFGEVNTTIHKNGYATYHQSVTNGTPVSNTGWHTVGLEWCPTYCKFYTDGVLKYTVTDPGFISKRPEFFILSNQIGFGGLPIDQAGNVYPTYTRYDYVRVYNKN